MELDIIRRNLIQNFYSISIYCYQNISIVEY